MSLEQQISKGIMEAMKAKEPVRLQTLRNIKKYIIEAKTAGTEIAELPDADVVKIIAKLAKQGSDSAEIYRQQNRADLAEEDWRGGRDAGVPAPAAVARGVDRSRACRHRRSGRHLGQGDGKGHGRCLEAACRTGRRQGHFGQKSGSCWAEMTFPASA